jgi:hypothetical protein
MKCTQSRRRREGQSKTSLVTVKAYVKSANDPPPYNRSV